MNPKEPTQNGEFETIDISEVEVAEFETIDITEFEVVEFEAYNFKNWHEHIEPKEEKE
ncbi:hypothetical protein GVN20_28240 [Runella sp. CRIBMP]|uniref:hypothetical protein n=1 Tax=Runella sp. CRIBMP TaxID=2683261 RepID=UPI0014125E5D|nr:hypothetical protein [Runella sp. CRIBMP]NBB23274.1 hypothetical protein [Runella sp. CRIBMP]